MSFDVREFEYILSIVEHGSVTKAAATHFITQPALTKFIQRKEAELGVTLFERKSKKLTPTYAGEQCIAAARKILSINNRLNDTISRIAAGHLGCIRFACHSSWSSFFFKMIYKPFHTLHPHIDLQIHEMNLSESLAALERAELDFAVVSCGWTEHANYRCNVLKKQKTVLAAGKNHPIIAKAKRKEGYRYPYIDIAHLHEVPLIMRQPHEQMYHFAMELLKNHSVEPHVVLETANKENALRVAGDGIGVTFTLDDPAMLVTHQKIQYLSLDEKLANTGYINIIFPKGMEIQSPHEDLIKLIMDYYQGDQRRQNPMSFLGEEENGR